MSAHQFGKVVNISPSIIYGLQIYKLLSSDSSHLLLPTPLLPLESMSSDKTPDAPSSPLPASSQPESFLILTPGPPRSAIPDNLLTGGLLEALGARQGARGSPVA